MSIRSNMLTASWTKKRK